MAKNLKTAETGLAAKSNDFFKGIAAAREAEEEMKVDWQLTDSKNKKVIENGKKLGHALAILRTDFWKEAERKKKGGDLTAQETTNFEKIKGATKGSARENQETGGRSEKGQGAGERPEGARKAGEPYSQRAGYGRRLHRHALSARCSDWIDSRLRILRR